MSSVANALFPDKVVNMPLVFSVPTALAVSDEGHSLGLLSDMSAEGWTSFRALVAALAGAPSSRKP